MSNSMIKQQRQSGAVSIFIVIFASLLMIVITMSFVQLMLKDQTQATANDLSQSALDSAQAGVEDAKRVLLMQQSCGSSTSTLCKRVSDAIISKECNSVSLALTGSTGKAETIVQQSAADGSRLLDQAYTCVKFLPAADYQGQLAKNESAVIPLRSASAFNRVTVNWFSKDDISTSGTITFPSTGSDLSLPGTSTPWPLTAPSLLRTQFIQTGSSFQLSDFDTKQGSGESDANTVFLYPLRGSNTSTNSLSDISNVDARRVASGSPQGVFCRPTFSKEYSCSVTIALPPYDGPFESRNAFLHLGSLYNATHYSIELFNGATQVNFDGVQSIIDSTGRANTIFRRVLTRVHLSGDFTYPSAAIDASNNICKTFSVTDLAVDYNAGTCDPTQNN